MTKYKITKFESQNFVALKKEWYQKLKESGFNDIECHSKYMNPTRFFKDYNPSYKIPRRYKALVEQYYRLARIFLNCSDIANRSFDYFVWKLHSEGLSKYKIAELLKDTASVYNLKDSSKPGRKLTAFYPNFIYRRIVSTQNKMFEYFRNLPYEERLDYIEDFEKAINLDAHLATIRKHMYNL